MVNLTIWIESKIQNLSLSFEHQFQNNPSSSSLQITSLSKIVKSKAPCDLYKNPFTCLNLTWFGELELSGLYFDTNVSLPYGRMIFTSKWMDVAWQPVSVNSQLFSSPSWGYSHGQGVEMLEASLSSAEASPSQLRKNHRKAREATDYC